MPLTITEIAQNNIIKVYYVKDKFEYRVEYYYDGEIDEEKTDKFTAIYGDKIETYEEKLKDGYKLEKTEGIPLIVQEYAGLNIIKIYYVKDKFEYKVEYYYDGVKDEKESETIEATYGDKIETYEEKLKDGYRFEKTENLPLILSNKVEENIINIYYVRKDSQVVVKYVDKQTGEEISESITKTGKVNDPYDITENKKEIEG